MLRILKSYSLLEFRISAETFIFWLAVFGTNYAMAEYEFECALHHVQPSANHPTRQDFFLPNSDAETVGYFGSQQSGFPLHYELRQFVNNHSEGTERNSADTAHETLPFYGQYEHHNRERK